MRSLRGSFYGPMCFAELGSCLVGPVITQTQLVMLSVSPPGKRCDPDVPPCPASSAICVRDSSLMPDTAVDDANITLQAQFAWLQQVQAAIKGLPRCVLSNQDVQDLVATAAQSAATTSSSAAIPLEQLLQQPVVLQQLQAVLVGVLQLTLLVCAQPCYHALLSASQAWAPAASRLQEAAKQLMSQLQQLAGAEGQPLWQQLLPCCRAAAGPLLQLCIASADLVAAHAAPQPPGSSSSSQGPLPPKEMASFVLLNLSWASLTRLLQQLPEGAAAEVLSPAALQTMLMAAAGHCHAAMRRWAATPSKSQQTVVKFWQQAVAKLVAAAPEVAAQPGPWKQLLLLAWWMGDQLQLSQGAVAQEVQDALLPRLLPSLMRALAAADPNNDTLTQCLATLTVEQGPEAVQSEHDSSSPRPCQRTTQLRLVMEILAAAPGASGAVAEGVAGQLLPWALQVQTQQLGADVLQQPLQGDPAAAAAVGPAGALLVAASTLLLGLSSSPDMAAAWQAAGAAVMSAVLSPHPLSRHVAAQLHLTLLAAAGPPQQLAALEDTWGLVLDVAAAEAGAAAHWGACTATQQLLGVLALWMQVLSPDQAAAWLLSQLQAATSTGPDAVSCCAVTALCALAHLLGLAASRPCCQEVVTHLRTLTGAVQQTLAVLQRPPSQVDPQLLEAAAHQAAWQLEAAAACMMLAVEGLGQQQQQPGAPQAPGSSLAGAPWAAGLAAHGMAALSLGLRTSQQQLQQPQVGGPPCYCLPALHVLGLAFPALAAGSSSSSHMDQLGELLLAAAAFPQLHVAVAGVAAHLGVGQRHAQPLFHTLLSSSAWPVAAAGRSALVGVSRAAGGPGFLSLVPPQLMVEGGRAACPAFISAFSGELRGEPDGKAQAAVVEAGPGRLQQLSAQLLAAATQLPFSPACCSSLPGWVAGVAAASQEPQQQQQAAAAAAVGGGVPPGQAAAAQLKELAGAARAQLAAVAQALDAAEAAVSLFATTAKESHTQWSGICSSFNAGALRTLTAPILGDLTSIGSRLRTLSTKLGN